MNPLDELKVYGDLLPIDPFKAVTIHPLADETQLLLKLNMQPEQCTSVDLYWVFRDEFIFVSIFSDKSQPPFVSLSRKPEKKRGFSFYIVTDLRPITTQIVRNCLEHLSDWWLTNETLIGKVVAKPQTTRISNADFGRDK